MAREEFLSFLQLDRNKFPMSQYMRHADNQYRKR